MCKQWGQYKKDKTGTLLLILVIYLSLHCHHVLLENVVFKAMKPIDREIIAKIATLKEIQLIHCQLYCHNITYNTALQVHHHDQQSCAYMNHYCT